MKGIQLGALLAVAVGAGFLAGRSIGPDDAGPPPPLSTPTRDDASEATRLRVRVAELEAKLEEYRHLSHSMPARDGGAATGNPAAKPSDGPAEPSKAKVEGTPRSALDSIQGQIQEKDRRIAELKAEVERLKATLPEPQVLRDLRLGEVQELIHLAGAIRQEVQARLLTPPEHLKSVYAEFLRRPNSGTARILPRGKYVHVVDKREGGAYWSFVTRDNDYDREPDLELQQGKFSSGFSGNDDGWILDLGETDLEQVGASVQAAPPGLEDRQREQWAFLWSDSAFLGAASPSAASIAYEALKKSARELGFVDGVPAVLGHTYVLRSVRTGEHDILVVFKAVQADDTGMSLVWQILKDWEIPRRR